MPIVSYLSPEAIKGPITITEGTDLGLLLGSGRFLRRCGRRFRSRLLCRRSLVFFIIVVVALVVVVIVVALVVVVIAFLFVFIVVIVVVAFIVFRVGLLCRNCGLLSGSGWLFTRCWLFFFLIVVVVVAFVIIFLIVIIIIVVVI